jgi:hypothetical protein
MLYFFVSLMNLEARIGILEVAANSDGAVVEIAILESRQQI